MNNYIWNRKDVDLLPEEIAPWEIPRDKHATISVLTHAMQELHTVDDYLSRCEQEFKVEYIKKLHGTTEQAWKATKSKLNAQLINESVTLFWNVYNSAATKSFGTASQTSMKLKVTLKNATLMPWTR